MNKYQLALTRSFKKDYQKILRRGYDVRLMDSIVQKLLAGESLPEKYQDHSLTGDWTGYRECHIQPDWLLIYQIVDDRLILSLSRTGTHSDVF